ncbi:MAG: hypothetical protein ACLRFL_01080 [Clostridia bacterium]
MRKKCTIEINDFGGLDSSSYNVISGEKLIGSKGIIEATFPKNEIDHEGIKLNIEGAGISSIDGLAYFKQYYPSNKSSVYRLLVHAGDKKVYINQLLCGLDGLFWLYNLSFENPPIILSFKQDDSDAIILTDKEKMQVWVTGYSPYTITDVPVITSMCMNDGVLFCTLQEPAFKIWYATNLDVENVGNIDKFSGYISLDDDLGYARKILTFDENVYIFRDYGISKVNFSKNSATFSQIYHSNTLIFSDTISACGKCILFATRDGLYSFNGVSVSKLKIDIFNGVDFLNSRFACASLGDEYFLSARINFDDGEKIMCENGEYVNNALIIINAENMTHQVIRGVDVGSLLAVKTEVFEKVLVTFNSVYNMKIGEIVNDAICFDDELPKIWKVNNLIDDYGTKLINRLTVYGKKGVKFRFLYDGKEISFVTYKDGINEFLFQFIAREVGLEVSSSVDFSVEKILVDYYAY